MIYEPHQCPIRFGLGVFGDRWSLLIVRDMLLRGHTRFQDFLDADEGISTNILTDRLRQLETQQVISRHKDPSDGRQVLYRLTDKGSDLLPVLLAIFVWAEKHDPETRVPRELAKRIKADLSATDEETLPAVRASVRDT
jgi:DNA-binding HxlR family transcriptional regulator